MCVWVDDVRSSHHLCNCVGEHAGVTCDSLPHTFLSATRARQRACWLLFRDSTSETCHRRACDAGLARRRTLSKQQRAPHQASASGTSPRSTAAYKVPVRLLPSQLVLTQQAAKLCGMCALISGCHPGCGGAVLCRTALLAARMLASVIELAPRDTASCGESSGASAAAAGLRPAAAAAVVASQLHSHEG